MKLMVVYSALGKCTFTFLPCVTRQGKDEDYFQKKKVTRHKKKNEIWFSELGVTSECHSKC